MPGPRPLQAFQCITALWIWDDEVLDGFGGFIGPLLLPRRSPHLLLSGSGLLGTKHTVSCISLTASHPSCSAPFHKAIAGRTTQHPTSVQRLSLEGKIPSPSLKGPQASAPSPLPSSHHVIRAWDIPRPGGGGTLRLDWLKARRWVSPPQVVLTTEACYWSAKELQPPPFLAPRKV